MAALALGDEHPALTRHADPDSRSPSTSQRRRPPSSIASTIARSRHRRSAASSASTSDGVSTLGNVRGARISGTDRPLDRAAGGSPTRAAPDSPSTSSQHHQPAEQPRHTRQPALDRARRQPRLAVGKPHHPAITTRPPLRGDERQHVRDRHLDRRPYRPPRRTPADPTRVASTVFRRARDATNSKYRSSVGCAQQAATPRTLPPATADTDPTLITASFRRTARTPMARPECAKGSPAYLHFCARVAGSGSTLATRRTVVHHGHRDHAMHL